VAKKLLLTYLQDKCVRRLHVYLQKILKRRILRFAAPVVILAVHRYTQNMFDKGYKQNGSGYCVEFPTELRSFHLITAKPKDSDKCMTELVTQCKINRL